MKATLYIQLNKGRPTEPQPIECDFSYHDSVAHVSIDGHVRYTLEHATLKMVSEDRMVFIGQERVEGVRYAQKWVLE
jgi:hypothetical protein